VSTTDHDDVRSRIGDLRKEAIRQARPGQREFSQFIAGRPVHVYAIRDMENPHPALWHYLDEIKDGAQCAIIYKDHSKEGLSEVFNKAPWELHVNGRLYGSFEEGEIDDVMAGLMLGEIE
jgi:hypothetical protein